MQRILDSKLVTTLHTKEMLLSKLAAHDGKVNVGSYREQKCVKNYTKLVFLNYSQHFANFKP